MAGPSSQPVLLDATKQDIPLPTTPGKEQEQEPAHKFVLELPDLDLAIDLGDWRNGSINGNLETTKCCHFCKAPLDKSGNTLDSEIAVKRPKPVNGYTSTLDPKAAFDRPEPSSGDSNTLDQEAAVSRPEASTGTGNTSGPTTAAQRPCDYILTLDTVSHWDQARSTYPSYQQMLEQVLDEGYKSIPVHRIRLDRQIMSLDYSAAFLVEFKILMREAKNLDASQEAELKAIKDRLREIAKRVRSSVDILPGLCRDLENFVFHPAFDGSESYGPLDGIKNDDPLESMNLG